MFIEERARDSSSAITSKTAPLLAQRSWLPGTMRTPTVW
jgi:hypothetical protein